MVALATMSAAAGKKARPASTEGKPSIAVLDFSLSTRVVEKRDACTRELKYSTKPVETEKDIRGWWFGAQDVRYNANTGRMAADLFSDALRESGAFKVYSREDLKYYYADKKDILREKFPTLTEDDLDTAVLTLNPISIAREIDVKKVITGHFADAEFRSSRSTGFFTGAVSFTVSVHDAKTGKLDFSREYKGVKALKSLHSTIEKYADEFVSEASAHYSSR